MKMTKGETAIWKKGAAFTPVEGDRGDEEEGKKEVDGKGKTVLVAIRTDSQSRELLTWALVKAAGAGDRVVALHAISAYSSGAAAASGEPGAVVALAREFDAMLAVYEGFCDLKQIDLKMKLCKGSSIRKVLVREARAFAASTLILGVDKKKLSLGSSPASIAKYCAKKLPSDCSVLALSYGKIVFQREAAGNLKNPGKSSKDSGKDSLEADGELYCLLPLLGKNGCNDKKSVPPIESTGGVNVCSINTADEDPSAVDASSSSKCSFCSPKSDVPLVNNLKNEGHLALAPVKRSEAPLRQSSKLAVVQWALQFRHRYKSVHPDRKFAKLDENVMQGIHESSAINNEGLSLPSLLVSDSNGRLLKGQKFPAKNCSFVCQLFIYEELERATSLFSPDNLIGRGGSSSVYKGCLPDGKEIAVKILESSTDAVKDFTSEIQILTTLNHKNIISILGYCLDKNKMILVYDYIPRGSLEEMLHGDKLHEHIISWPERYKVAIGVAEALDYLHEGSSGREPVIHRDVKSSNILLYENFEPQLSDFGLARWASASTSDLACNDTAGTFGYLAPELFTYGRFNEKADVYAFGVVLLELLSGRMPISTSCPKGPESLVGWAKQMLQSGEFRDLLDPSISNEYDDDQAERMALAASLCIRRLHQVRPKMSLVVKILKGDAAAVKWATAEGLEGVEEEELIDSKSDIQSHLSLALLDAEDDILSIGSADHTFYSSTTSNSMRDNSECTWSRSASFE